jgi:fermentation-respiration switch protein FrsA (DUF1100 family)
LLNILASLAFPYHKTWPLLQAQRHLKTTGVISMKILSRPDIIFRLSGKIAALIALVLCFSGCTNFIFQPDRFNYFTPKELELDFRDVFLKTFDDIQIHGWFLKATGIAKGTVYVLHGNAQNISSHVVSISWLPGAGYNVFIIDYRGYGDSTGEPDIGGIMLDIGTGFKWLGQNSEVQNKPLYLMGQSIGAAVGVYYVANYPEIKRHLTGVILDASFSRYRTIAQEKFADHWLTWLFQYPLSLLFSNKYDPEDFIDKISPVPVLIMHSKGDTVVPFVHGKRLFEVASQPKFFIETKGGHIETFLYDQYRKDALEFMANAAERRNP